MCSFSQCSWVYCIYLAYWYEGRHLFSSYCCFFFTGAECALLRYLQFLPAFHWAAALQCTARAAGISGSCNVTEGTDGNCEKFGMLLKSLCIYPIMGLLFLLIYYTVWILGAVVCSSFLILLNFKLFSVIHKCQKLRFVVVNCSKFMISTLVVRFSVLSRTAVL